MPGQCGYGAHPSQKGGTHIGPNPTDRGKPGAIRHLIVDRTGIPLVIRVTAANVHDVTLPEPLRSMPPPSRRRVGNGADGPPSCMPTRPTPRWPIVRRCVAVTSPAASPGLASSRKRGGHPLLDAMALDTAAVVGWQSNAPAMAASLEAAPPSPWFAFSSSRAQVSMRAGPTPAPTRVRSRAHSSLLNSTAGSFWRTRKLPDRTSIGLVHSPPLAFTPRN